jgi:23S rRNA (guanosine2251-2'-O)-methyltransferase
MSGHRRPRAPVSRDVSGDTAGRRDRGGRGTASRSGRSQTASRSNHGAGDDGGWVVSGRRAVLEAIRSGRARSVIVARGSKATPALREILDAAAARHVTVREDDRERLDALATDHRGVVARISAPAALGERELASFAFEDDALVVVLDGIEDPHNLGAAARAAEAAGASMLVSRTRRAADVTEAAVRASAGALLHLPHARVANVTRALERLKVVGFTVAGLSEDADASIYEESPPEGRVAIVLGSEGTGMSRLVREACDVVVGLPMLGEVGSLNASTSLAAVLYAWVLASRRRPSGPAAGT